MQMDLNTTNKKSKKKKYIERVRACIYNGKSIVLIKTQWKKATVWQD